MLMKYYEQLNTNADDMAIEIGNQVLQKEFTPVKHRFFLGAIAGVIVNNEMAHNDTNNRVHTYSSHNNTSLNSFL